MALAFMSVSNERSGSYTSLWNMDSNINRWRSRLQQEAVKLLAIVASPAVVAVYD